ncbi:hypothetical protein B296_00022990 [Ensete ventricosum]|uniref:Uncharacterized protein n=1 Tax=Ensete ventricosum TaxID=4639 RepID=A0A426YE24_ENSVE|nr:hypothetical protein B296_00022990 [Ensete ventricosum]
MNNVNGSVVGSSSGSGDGSAPRRNSKRPKFTQQELPACKPILTPKWVRPSSFFLPVVEIVDRYDNVCVPSNMTSDKVAYIQNDDVDKTCSRTLKVVCPVLYRVLPSKDENRKRTEQLIVLT